MPRRRSRDRNPSPAPDRRCDAMVADLAFNQGVGGSTPLTCTSGRSSMVEYQILNLGVEGSNPSARTKIRRHSLGVKHPADIRTSTGSIPVACTRTDARSLTGQNARLRTWRLGVRLLSGVPIAPVTQWIEYRVSTPRVEGSTPPRRANMPVAQWIERLRPKQRAEGSSPSGRTRRSYARSSNG